MHLAGVLINNFTGSNISKTSASALSGVSNTKRPIKAQHKRQSAFIVSRCEEPPMKNKAQVFDGASQTFFGKYEFSVIFFFCDKFCLKKMSIQNADKFNRHDGGRVRFTSFWAAKFIFSRK